MTEHKPRRDWSLSRRCVFSPALLHVFANDPRLINASAFQIKSPARIAEAFITKNICNYTLISHQNVHWFVFFGGGVGVS